jgi:uncharacterized protein
MRVSPLMRGRLIVCAAGIIVGCALIAASFAASPAAPEIRVRIAFLGDSTADGLWGGFTSLVPHASCLKDVFELGRFAKNSTGLSRPEKYDWAEEARRIAEGFKPQLVIISLGLNDRQSVVDRTETGARRVTQYESPEWPDKYRERVTAMLRGAMAAKASVLWVGLAAMRDNAANADAQLKNKLFEQAVADLAVGSAQYVPPWKLNEQGVDVFTSYAPDKHGKMVHIRASDGEHFTAAGDELVATYLLPKIVATLRDKGIEIDRTCPVVAQ